MKTLTPLLTATAGVVSSSVVLGMTPVFAATFQTTFTLDSPGGTPFIDTIVFDWETDITSGNVTKSDLTNWSYELFGMGSSVYSETVVLDGVVQPIGGVSRTIDDIQFDFNLNTLNWSQFYNDFPTVQQGAATGVTLVGLSLYSDTLMGLSLKPVLMVLHSPKKPSKLGLNLFPNLVALWHY